jgi:valyl-tRNA synthetase
MELPKAYNPKEAEERIYRLWEKSGFFNPNGLPKRYGREAKRYVIMLPPPNITGSLHMGHALNAVVQDVLIRQKRMQGYTTLWLPGTDHAGIAAQNVVEKELKKEGLTRFDLGREKFLERMWKWKKRYGDIILEQFKKLGASCDWSRTVFTMDNDYAKAVATAFIHYYDKGWIYRAKRVVNWCPRCHTSLSDLELEYKEEAGKLWYIKYPLIQNSKLKTLNSQQTQNSKLRNAQRHTLNAHYIVVATTRPETMLGDTAVAVNPQDKRYKNLIGRKALLPLVNREIPIVADKLVDPNFGTGAVKVTPAHDLIDYDIGLRHKLPSVQVIDETGSITASAPLAYQGLRGEEARRKIVEDLQTQGFLEKVEDYTHQIPKCYRCNTTIELIPSWQWFLKMDDLARIAIRTVKSGKVRFIPKRWEKVYFAWLENGRDWCISRQLWWGHRIPIWFCANDNNEHQIQSETHNSSAAKNNYVASVTKPKKCPFCGKCAMEQSEDVLDTWFSSALWPFATLGWPDAFVKAKNGNQKAKGDLARFYPTNVLSTDRGIINLWVARMIFSGMEFMGKEPFRDVYIHATVLTREGKRMSKSLGTGIDPVGLIEKYGADATRFGIAWQITDLQDIRFGEENLLMGQKFCNKIWNAARFVLLQMSNSNFQISDKFPMRSSQLTHADRKILLALKKAVREINNDLARYRFGKAAQRLYHFFWHNFCDVYIETAKLQIQNSKSAMQKKQTQQILLYVLVTSLKLLHPFAPFITEEIYQKLPLKNKKTCLMIEEWPRLVRAR